ncbi:hypothetical protein [Saccharibacillus endophyticus]|uniref:Uncharacterized protein n=1 Tax=Saccharibacillus endophyticus TaxID=2060666 RepID=A0ABQ1ZM07_9BACL|nr:hypothetical protein [Saccharibacillus endophyticus]GGH70056.1 hypothetical protein GCM10007362_05760 [Saccharibacillus endophyticus]
MNINKKTHFFKLLAIPAIALVTASLIAPGVGQASESEPTTDHIFTTLPEKSLNESLMEPGALTPPPPPTLYYEGFTSSLITSQYLVSAYSNLSISGSSSLQISAETKSSASASQGGVTVGLERWTGSDWVEFGKTRTKSSALAYNSLNYASNVTKGYYYRIKSDHWASSGINKESRTLYSSTVFVSN